jgi:hypothetical protein
MNAKSLFVGAGDDIASISVNSPIALALCTEDGSGFFENHLYFRNYDSFSGGWSGWNDVFNKHTHSDDTDTEGGDYYDIDIANADSVISIMRPYLQEEMFFWDVNGSGTAVETVVAGGTQFLRLRTGTTTDNWAQAQQGGMRLSVSSKVEWHAKFEIDGDTAILWRMGVGMERVQESSESTLNKFGLEGCTGDGTTIQLVSCNGTSRIKTNTTVAMDQNAAIGAKITYIPSTSVVYTDTLSTVKVSTGGIPSSGFIGSDKTLRYGIKTTNSTEKLMFIWADALYGKILDPSWI